MKNKSRPVVIVFSVLAALQILTSGSALADIIGVDIAALVVLVIAAVQVGMTFYVENSTVPLEDVAAFETAGSRLIAGPAAHQEDGTDVHIIADLPPHSGPPSTNRA